MDKINSNTGSIAPTPPNATKYLSKKQRQKALAKAAAAHRARNTKRPSGNIGRKARKIAAKARRAQKKLKTRNCGPRRFN